MENDNLEQQPVDPRKNRYVVYTRRDVAMMKTFIRFSNRVRHPRAGMNMFILGALLIALPIANKGIAMTGAIISYVMGALLLGIALFRTSISVMMMKNNPELHENEELIYQFGNSGIRVERNGKVENMGFYKTVYRVWEDEKHFYIGLDSEDLLVLPKMNFTEGDPATFRDFILEKSGAEFRWKPTQPVNIVKDKWMKLQMKMAGIGQEIPDEKKKEKK